MTEALLSWWWWWWSAAVTSIRRVLQLPTEGKGEEIPLIMSLYYQEYFLPYKIYWGIGTIAVLVVLLWEAKSYVKDRIMKKKYDIAARKHRAQQSAAIEAFIKNYPAPRMDLFEAVLAASVKDLVENVKSGKWLAVDVVTTFCHRAAAVHLELNCLTEIMFESAVERARELDARRIKEGCLFGVPISVKDNFGIEGVPSSIGVFRWREEKISKNATIINNLLKAGAIPFCKTNVPQTMLNFECSNPLWGVTENPFVKGFTPGGSSGGEAALIGAGGSVLGLGNDIGGSLRIPSHFSGICCIKSSNYRLPQSGIRSFHPGRIMVQPVCGPMARTVEDMIPFMEACFGNPDLDTVPCSNPFSLSGREKGKKLTFGVVRHLPFLEALPPCTRAVDEAVCALQADGHQMVEFSFPFSTTDLVSLYYRVISSDGGYFYKEILNDEPIEEILKPFIKLLSKTTIGLGFFAWMTSFYADKRPMRFLDSLGVKDAIAISRMIGDREEFILKMNAAWEQAKIDFLIMPGFPCPAIPHGAFSHVPFAASYTFIWNLLDYVAGVVPVTKVDPEKDFLKIDETAVDYTSTTGNSSQRLLEAEVEHIYCSKRMAGLPVGVQVITPQFQEAEALLAMKALQDSLEKYNPPSHQSINQ